MLFYITECSPLPTPLSVPPLRMMKVASQFQSRGLSYAVANRAEFQDELEEEFSVGPDGGELPIIFIRTTNGHKYIMQEEFT